jgi:LAO/AO transport system kinase
MRPVAAPAELAEAVRAGQRRALARAITLIESERDDHRRAADQLLQQLLTDTGKARRLGISGTPGVGKSSFIEALGMHALERGHRIAVLSIDPSSSISGGSILGDKTRMESLARQTQAFIRPSPAGGTLGGVARRTREALLLCEAAGFDTIIVETVGVGQSETAVAEMTDMFILLLLPGGGDELQGIKRGIMELADLILINKADGERVAAARRSVADYRNALQLMQPRSRHWQVPVEMCSARNGDGIAETWQIILDYQRALSTSGEIGQRRAAQARSWLWQETTNRLLNLLKTHPEVRRHLNQLETEVQQGRSLPTSAAQQLIGWFLDNR